MPVSAYLKAGLFVVAAAAALFAAAGTVAIPGFWAYLAIFAVVMIVSFAALDPDLLRERMRPGGKKPPLALRVFSLVLFMHWIVAGLDLAASIGATTCPTGCKAFACSRSQPAMPWHSDHSGKRTRARIVARGRVRCDLHAAVSALSHHHGGSNSSGRACGLFGLRRAGPMAARPGHLVSAKPHLGKHAAHRDVAISERKQASHV